MYAPFSRLPVSMAEGPETMTNRISLGTTCLPPMESKKSTFRGVTKSSMQRKNSQETSRAVSGESSGGLATQKGEQDGAADEHEGCERQGTLLMFVAEDEKWAPRDITLTTDKILICEQSEAEGRTFRVKDIRDVSRDNGDITFACEGKKTVLRAKTSKDAKEWHDTLKAFNELAVSQNAVQNQSSETQPPSTGRYSEKYVRKIPSTPSTPISREKESEHETSQHGILAVEDVRTRTNSQQEKNARNSKTLPSQRATIGSRLSQTYETAPLNEFTFRRRCEEEAQEAEITAPRPSNASLNDLTFRRRCEDEAQEAETAAPRPSKRRSLSEDTRNSRCSPSRDSERSSTLTREEYFAERRSNTSIKGSFSERGPLHERGSASERTEVSGETSVVIEILEAIEHFLHITNKRISGIFRNSKYNHNFVSENDVVDAQDIQAIFARAGLDLSLKQISCLVRSLSKDKAPRIAIQALETTMRNFRNGSWNSCERTSLDEAPKHASNAAYINSLFEDGKFREMRALERKRADLQTEATQIQSQIEENRVGSRSARVVTKDWKSVSNRLYDDRQAQQEAKKCLRLRRKNNEEMEIRQARFKPIRSASDPQIRRDVKKRNGDYMNIGHRLHALQKKREEKHRARLEENEARLLMQLDTTTKLCHQGGQHVGDRNVQLHEDAKNRTERRNLQKWGSLESEIQRVAFAKIHKNRTALIHGQDFDRLDSLYEDGASRLDRLRRMREDALDREQRTIKHRASMASFGRTTRLLTVESKWKNHFDEVPPPRKPQSEKTLGFGAKTRRSIWGDLFVVSDVARAGAMQTTEHIFGMMNNFLALRANCTAEDVTRGDVEDVVNSLQEVLDWYSEAQLESTSCGEGSNQLRTMPSYRLFGDGKLTDEAAGWKSFCEADKIRQVDLDLETLLEQAERAQAQLLAAVGPGVSDSEGPKFSRRWPPGCKWNRPACSAKARFAFNPGPKSREAAVLKATRQYGPSCFAEEKYWHVMDFARCCLIYVDAAQLRGGVDQICKIFEVISIRNGYGPLYQSICGHQCVEVLVVMRIPEPFVCEIRLEEHVFFVARQQVTSHVENIATIFENIYGTRGVDPDVIKHSVQRVLYNNKEPHAVTVFKRHLARRYGSNVCVWRKALGDSQVTNFNTFRRLCAEVDERHRVSEFFQLIDPTLAGNVSLYDLDPDEAILLIRMYWKIIAFRSKFDESWSGLIARVLNVSGVGKNGNIVRHELRKIMKVLGFNADESDKVFSMLDIHGAGRHPASLELTDLLWLGRIPQLVDIDSIMFRRTKESHYISSSGGARVAREACMANNLGRQAWYSSVCTKMSSNASKQGAGRTSYAKKTNTSIKQASPPDSEDSTQPGTGRSANNDGKTCTVSFGSTPVESYEEQKGGYRDGNGLQVEYLNDDDSDEASALEEK